MWRWGQFVILLHWITYTFFTWACKCRLGCLDWVWLEWRWWTRFWFIAGFVGGVRDTRHQSWWFWLQFFLKCRGRLDSGFRCFFRRWFQGGFSNGVDFLTALGVFFEGVPFFLEDRIGEVCCLDVDCGAFAERVGVFELNGGCLAGVICDFGLARWTGFDEAIFDTCWNVSFRLTGMANDAKASDGTTNVQ